MVDSLPPFQQTQYAFAAAIRNPEAHPPPPGVAPERMKLYRDLFFNNVQGFIAGGFPVLRELLDETAWQSLLGDFFTRHKSILPYFSGIPAEFLAYLRDERGEHPNDPPFLLELAHYEWVELALSVAVGETPADSRELMADPLICRLELSPTAWPLAYRFPVHRICRDFQPRVPPTELTCLAVYRDRDDLVRFLEINPVTYRLLCMVEEDPALPALHYLEPIAVELGHRDATQLLTHGAELLRGLARRGIIGLA